MAEYVTDEPIWTEELMIMGADRLGIPGVEMFGYNCSTRDLHIMIPHMHKTAEFLCFANGSQKYYIGDQEYTMRGNQVLIVDGDVVHSTGSIPYGRYEHLWFRMDVNTFADSLPIRPEQRDVIKQRLRNLSDPLISLPEAPYPDLLACFFHLASEDPAKKLQGYSEFLNFICRLVRNTDPVRTYSPSIQKALTYISENICSHIPLTGLADLCGLSLSGFKQKFRRETGITPREYINLTKISKAQELLAAGHSVTDTAFALDFTSSSYFSVLFRQVTDQTPSEYIQACAEKQKNQEKPE